MSKFFNFSIILHLLVFVILIYNPIQSRHNHKMNLSSVNLIILEDPIQEKIIKLNKNRKKIEQNNLSSASFSSLIESKKNVSGVKIDESSQKIKILNSKSATKKKINKIKFNNFINDEIILKRNDKNLSKSKIHNVKKFQILKEKSQNLKKIENYVPLNKNLNRNISFSSANKNFKPLNENKTSNLLNELGFKNSETLLKDNKDVSDSNKVYCSNNKIKKLNKLEIRDDITIKELLLKNNYYNKIYNNFRMKSNITINQLLSRNNIYYSNNEREITIKSILNSMNNNDSLIICE